MKENIIQSTVTPTIRIVVQGAGDVPDRKWTLCLDYRALAKIEDETGLDLKHPGSWPQIKSGNTFPVIVWCCLQRYSSEVTLDEVKDSLNPQAHAALWSEMYEITFPDVVELWAEMKAKGTLKAASPNEKPDPKTP